MGMAAVSKRGIIAVRRKAVLKHTQSKRWREIWCGPAIAKRLDCVRFIAALSRPFLTPSAAKTLNHCPPASESRLKANRANRFGPPVELIVSKCLVKPSSLRPACQQSRDTKS